MPKKENNECSNVHQENVLIIDTLRYFEKKIRELKRSFSLEITKSNGPTSLKKNLPVLSEGLFCEKLLSQSERNLPLGLCSYVPN